MFWLHGGGLQYGTSVQSLYDGSAFAAFQNVIMVTTNYRTNGMSSFSVNKYPRTSKVD